MKAEGNLSKRESSTFGKHKWKKRFGRVADEKFHIFEAQGDSKAKSVLDVMKANDLCKAPSVEPMYVFEFSIAGKVYSFAATSSEERQRFMNALLQNGALPSQLMSHKEVDQTGEGLTELPKSVLYMQEAERINLSENSLQTIPDEIGSFEKLENLNLSFNQLKALPDTIKLLAPSLRELNLTKNALANLPDLSSFTNLQLLWIGQNKLTDSPPGMTSLVGLQRLSLASNPWNSFPDIGPLVNLRWLDISGCKLSALPETLRQLVRLEVLEAFNNAITEIPDWIALLSKLSELRLQRNKIAVLPDALQKLQLLQEMDVSHNALKSLPKWIAECNAFVELHNNPYDDIPREVVLAGSQSIRQFVREKS